jgi:Flp pilus assembly protein TadD
MIEAVRRWRAGREIARARRVRRRNGPEAAVQVLLASLDCFPEEAELWNELSVLKIELKDFEAAARAVRRALDIRPNLPQAHCNLGIVLAEGDEEEAALKGFERALELDPELDVARENRAMLLSRIPRLDAAIAAWDEILGRDPQHPRAHAMKSGLLMCSGRFAEAGDCLSRAEALGIGTPDIALYRAVVEADIGDPVRAAREIEALRGHVSDNNVDWNLALVYLAQGDYARGWPLYERRPTRTRARRRTYGLPEWDGKSLPAGALLVLAEQGLGDEVMFASCYPDVLNRAPGCVIECDPRLAQLYRRTFPDAQVIGISRDNDGAWLRSYPQIQYRVLAGSLPRHFRTSIGSFPRHTGYLSVDPARVEEWRRRLAALPGHLNIGIAWSGGLAHTRRALRCIPLEDMAGLLRDMPHSFVSLQHDDDGSEASRLAELSGMPVHRFPDALANIDEQAALLSALDLIITACSSVVHLSGAVGARTWVLTPRIPEWRYLHTGETMPWYPSVRLLRQEHEGKWASVIAGAAADISALDSLSPGGRHSMLAST